MAIAAQLLSFLPIPALAFVALTDLVSRRVPNWVCAFIAGFGLATRIAAGDVLPSLLVAVLVFTVLAAACLLGKLGGGDVKLLAASTLLLPVQAVPVFVLAVAVAGGLLALPYLPGRFGAAPPRWLAAPPASAVRRICRVEFWRSRRRAPLPYACAIAAGAVFTLVTG